MYGKIFFALLGAACGLLLQNTTAAVALALGGLAIGHFFFDRRVDAPRSESPKSKRELLKRRDTPAAPMPASNTALAQALGSIFIEVARADSSVTQDEVRVAREFFSERLHFSGNDLEVLRDALKQAINSPPRELEPLVKEARSLVKPADRVLVVNGLYEMALVDGQLRRAEHDALKRVVAAFNLAPEQLQEITQTLLGSAREHFVALGLSDDAQDDEIKAAFKRLATEFHPDRHTHLGPEKAEAAAAKFRAVKDAYEALKALRGF